MLTGMQFLRLTNVILTTLMVLGGAIVASFWAVVAQRSVQGRDWVRGRSECDWCHHKISWWQNIPLVSFLLLRGRCHYCRKLIRRLYFVWEALLGAWTAIWFWCVSPLAPYLDATNLKVLDPFFADPSRIYALAESLILLVVGAILIWTAIVDVYTHSIANGWLAALGIAVVCLITVKICAGTCTWAWLVSRFLGSAGVGLVFGLIDYVARRVWGQTGIGLGDTLLTMAVAWWLTLPQLTVMFLLAFWLGAIVGLLLMAFWKRSRSSAVAFLPFIVMAFFGAYFCGEWLWSLMVPGVV